MFMYANVNWPFSHGTTITVQYHDDKTVQLMNCQDACCENENNEKKSEIKRTVMLFFFLLLYVI